MIRPLRRRHRAMVLGIALVLPPLYVTSLRGRADVPLSNALASTVLAVPTEGVGRPLALTWLGGPDVAARLFRGGVIELRAREDLRRPDVLVYWSPVAAAALGGIPGDPSRRVLLGTLAGTQPRGYPLPPDAFEHDGVLSLFSLAHGEELGRAALPALGQVQETDGD